MYKPVLEIKANRGQFLKNGSRALCSLPNFLQLLEAKKLSAKWLAQCPTFHRAVSMNIAQLPSFEKSTPDATYKKMMSLNIQSLNTSYKAQIASLGHPKMIKYGHTDQGKKVNV